MNYKVHIKMISNNTTSETAGLRFIFYRVGILLSVCLLEQARLVYDHVIILIGQLPLPDPALLHHDDDEAVSTCHVQNKQALQETELRRSHYLRGGDKEM